MLSPLNKTITQKDVRAEDSVYLSLPGCCQYDCPK